MVKYETLAEDNNFIRAYSDANVKIHGGYPEGDYNQAIDPVSMGRIYKETDVPIDVYEEDLEDEEATIEDYVNALNVLGVNVDEEENS